MTARTPRTGRWSHLLAAAALVVLHPATAPAGPAESDPSLPAGWTSHRDGKDHPTCSGGTAGKTGLYKSCGEFPQSLPMSFAFNAQGARIATSDFSAAVRGAAAAWNRPYGPAVDSPYGTVLSISGSAPNGLAKDGVNVVLWGDPADCGLPGAIAVACLYYGGTSVAGRHRIVEVDIILSDSESWRHPDGTDATAGHVTGNAAMANPSAGWFDVQSAITHEFGHALGLEHIGNGSYMPNFRDLTDAGKHVQTMYAVDFRGSTAKRTLEAGDILGLAYVTEQVN